MQMVLPDGKIELPSGSPFRVRPDVLRAGQKLAPQDVEAAYGTGLSLTGTFSGPGISTTDVNGDLQGGLSLPAMTDEGDYTLSAVRLWKDGKAILDATPATKTIRCLGQVLISSVTSSPMTLQEIKDAGLQLGAENYEAKRFTMAMAIGSQEVTLKVPVAVPVYNGVPQLTGDSVFGPLEITGSHGEKPPIDITVVAANLVPPSDKLPTFDRPGVAHVLRHAFKGLLVIPGTIGYLHQFYKTDVVVLNTLDAASPYRISHLKATFQIPPGLDGQPGTNDDPLRLAYHLGETADAEKPLLGPDGSGKVGHGDAVITGGQSAMATYYIEGLKEGAHALDFRIEGQFEGGDLTEPIPVFGTASGKVLVRNPSFSLVLVHPDVVRKGEVYTLEARLTNTSGTLANDVHLTIDQTRLTNLKLVSDPIQKVDTLNPGDTASLKFQFKAKVTGEVRSAYLYIEDGGTISYQLSVGVGERNIRLNPDTLVLPDTLNALPEDLREAMLKVLGQAYSIATSRGSQPAGVLPIPLSVVTGDMAGGLSEQGVFLRMGAERPRVWWELWKLFMQNPDPGFDQLVRTTVAGQELRSAFLHDWAWADAQNALTARTGDLAAFGYGTPDRVLVTIDGAGEGLLVSGQDGSGQKVGNDSGAAVLPASGMAWASSDARQLVTWPVSADQQIGQLTLNNPTPSAMNLTVTVLTPAVGSDPVLRQYSLSLGSTVRAVLPLDGGDAMFRTFAASGDPLTGVRPDNSRPVPAEPFQAIGVHRYDREIFADANPYGTQVMVLFNRPVMDLDLPSGDDGFAQAQALVQVEANRPWKKAMPPELNDDGSFKLDDSGKVVLQAAPAPLTRPFPRIASLFLEKPVGPYVARNLSLSGNWKDKTGQAIGGVTTWPITSGMLPGGAVVRGKVRKADGTAVPTLMDYWYRQLVDRSDEIDLGTGVSLSEEEWEQYFALVSNQIATEADGTFQLDFVPEPVTPLVGPFVLQAKVGSSNASAGAAVLGNGQNIQMDLVLEGMGNLEGYVVDANGAPVPNVTVEAAQLQNNVSFSAGAFSSSLRTRALTDAQGYYRINDLKTGAFSLKALKTGVGGLFGVATSGSIDRDGQTVRKDLVLKTRVGTVKVKLLDLDGTPMLNRWIRLGFKAGLVNRTTGNTHDDWIYPEERKTIQGSDWVLFDQVPTGDIRVYTPEFPDGFATTFEGFLDPDQTLEVTLRRLSPDMVAQVRIHVVDSAGVPVPGAYVLVGSGGNAGPTGIDVFDSQTDENGDSSFIRKVVPMTVVAWAYHPKWNSSYPGEVAVLEGGKQYVLRVTLPARTSLEGRVTRKDGTPVAGAIVAIPPIYAGYTIGGDSRVRGTLENRLVRTDQDGRYRFESIQLSRTYRVAVVGPEGLTSANQEMPPAVGGQSLHLDSVLPAVGGKALKGSLFLLQDDGTRIPTAGWVDVEATLPDVLITNDGSLNWGLPMLTRQGSVQTQLDGTYHFENLQAGAFRVSAGRTEATEAQVSGSFVGDGSETRTVDLAIRNTFTAALKGRVTMPDGQTPVAKGARVRLLNQVIGEMQVEVQDDGIYKFPKVIPAGSYQLRVEDPQTGLITVVLVSIANQESVIKNLRLWGKGNLHLTLQDSLGQPLPEAVVTLEHSRKSLLLTDDLPAMSQKLIPAQKGEVLFEDLIEGRIAIEVKNPNGLTGRGAVEIPMGGGDVTAVVRLQPVGDLVGLLRRADGSTVVAGRLDAYWVDGSQTERWLGTSPTDQDGVSGRFIFKGLPAGIIRLRAWDPDSRQSGSAVVEVKEGQTVSVDMSTQDLGPVQVTVRLNGAPVLKAGVVISAIGTVMDGLGDFEATTDDQGHALVQMPPGTYRIHSVDPQSLSTGDMDFQRAPNQGELDLTLDLQSVRSLWVTVQPPTGWGTTTLDGWRALENSIGRTAMLDASGQGTLQELTVGTHSIEIRDAQGYTRGTFQAVIKADGSGLQPLAVQALPLGTVKVRVTDAEGQPKAYVSPSLGGMDLSHQPIITDANGEGVSFPVLGLPGVASYGSARARFQVASEGQVVEVSLKLAPTASIHGIVRDAEGHAMPFIGVRAWTQGYDMWVKEAATDATGAFTVAGLPLATNVQLQAKTLDGRASTIQPLYFTQVEDREINLTVPVLGALHAHFVDPLRPAMPPMTLQVLDAATGLLYGSQPLDGNGAADVAGIPALQDLVARLRWDDKGVVAYSTTFRIAGAGQVQSMDVTLDPFVNLKGWTLDTQNRKVPMSVVLQDASGKELDRVTTAGDIYDPDQPTFTFRYLHAGTEYHLVGLKEGTQVPVAFKAYTPAGTTLMEQADLVAQAESLIHVRFKTPSGSPVQVAAPLVVYPNGDSLDMVSLGDGTFNASVPAKVPVSVKVSGYVLGEDLTLAVGGVPDPGTTLEVELTLPDLGTIRGRLLGADGQPMLGTVQLIDGLATRQAVATGADGTFELTRVRTITPMSLSVVDGVQEASAQVQILGAGSVQTQDLQLNGLVSVRVHVTSADGKGVQDRTVNVLRSNGNWLATMRTDATGMARIQGLPASRDLRIGVQLGQGYSTKSLNLPYGSAEPQMEFTDTPPTSIAGRVVRANPALPWPDGTRLVLSQGVNLDLPLNPDGTFEPQNNLPLNSNTIRAYVTVGGFNVLTQTLVPVQGGVTQLNLVAPAFGTIQPRVLRNGVPVEGASVFLDQGTLGGSDLDGKVPAQIRLAGSHQLTATTSQEVAWTQASIDTDGQSLNVDLPLTDGKVTFPASLPMDRLGISMNVSPWETPQLEWGTDGGMNAATWPQAARWIQAGRSLAWDDARGDVTLHRVFSSVGYGLRQELIFTNQGSAPRTVKFRIRTWNSPDAASIGTPDQLGGASFPGIGQSLLWGKGSYVPSGLPGPYATYLEWPDLVLQPGETKGLWIGHVQYGYQETLQAEGLPRAMARANGLAPEWIAGVDPRVNLMAPQTIQEGLPAWDAQSTFDLRDPVGQPVERVVDTMIAKVIPNEVLAPVRIWRWYPYQVPAPFSQTVLGLPSDGSRLFVNQPGSTDTFTEIPLPSGAQIQVPLMDRVVVQARVIDPLASADTPAHLFSLNDSAWGHAEDLVHAGTQSHRFLGAPGDLLLMLSHGQNAFLKVSQTISLSAGQVASVDLQMPGYGSVLVRVPNDLGTMALQTGDQTSYATWANGGYSFPAVATGLQKLTVSPLYSGASWTLDPIQVNTGANIFDLPVGVARVSILSGGTYLGGTFTLRFQRDGGQMQSVLGNPGSQSLPAGNYTVSFTDPRTNAQLSQSIQLGSGETKDVVFNLATTGNVVVRAKSASGKTSAYVLVEALGVDGGRTSGYTDVNGLVTLTNVAVGTATIQASNLPNQDYTDTALIKNTVTIQQGVSVAAEIVYPDLVSVNVVGVSLQGTQLPVAWLDGQFTLQNLYQPGTRVSTSLFRGIPIGLPIGPTYENGSYGVPATKPTAQIAPTTANQTLTFTYPLGRVRLHVLANGQPKSGVQVQLNFGGTYAPVVVSDANGFAEFPFVPTGTSPTYTLTFGSVTSGGSLTFPGPSLDQDVTLPVAKAIVQVFRANGQVPSGYWSFRTSDGQSPTTTAGNSATWDALPMGSQATFIATRSQGFYLGWNWINDVWEAQASSTLSNPTQNVQIVLAPRAGLQVRYQDVKGNPLVGLPSGDWWLRVTDSTNPQVVGRDIHVDSFSPLDLPELFPVGEHRVELRSDLWGPMGSQTVTVAPEADGTQVPVTLSLDVVTQPLTLKAVAGDGVTPVPMAGFNMKTPSGIGFLGSLAEPDAVRSDALAEGAALRTAVVVPTNRAFTLVSFYSGMFGYVEIEGASHATGGEVVETATLPLTVVRARLNDLDGSSMDSQAHELASMPGNRLPLARISGALYGLWLGASEGTTDAMTLFDLSSGLGAAQSVTVPALGQHGDVGVRIPDYAWLTAPTLQRQHPNTETLLVSIERGAAGLVRPDCAQWLCDSNAGWSYAQYSVSLSNGGATLSPRLDLNLGRDTLAVPAGKVRIPLVANVWLAEAGGQLREDGTMPPAAWGVTPINADSGTTVSAQANEFIAWVSQEVQILDASDMGISGQRFDLGLHNGPSGWGLTSMYLEYSDAPAVQGLQVLVLPVGLSVDLSLVLPTCGTGWYGDWTYVQPSQPPTDRPVFKSPGQKQNNSGCY